jgi:hypothetical protein
VAHVGGERGLVGLFTRCPLFSLAFCDDHEIGFVIMGWPDSAWMSGSVSIKVRISQGFFHFAVYGDRTLDGRIMAGCVRMPDRYTDIVSVYLACWIYSAVNRTFPPVLGVKRVSQLPVFWRCHLTGFCGMRSIVVDREIRHTAAAVKLSSTSPAVTCGLTLHR